MTYEELAALRFMCGWALNAAIDENRGQGLSTQSWAELCSSTLLEWRAGSHANRCGRVATFLALHCNGPVPYCCHCFCNDGAVLAKSHVILKLPGYSDKDRAYVEANMHWPPNVNYMPHFTSFAMASEVWQDYVTKLPEIDVEEKQ